MLSNRASGPERRSALEPAAPGANLPRENGRTRTGTTRAMALGRFLGWLLLVAAVLVGGYDAYQWHFHDLRHVTAAGELWRALSPATLDRLRAGVQHHAAPALWDRLVGPILNWPATAVLGVPGLLLAILCRRRHSGRSPRRFAK